MRIIRVHETTNARVTGDLIARLRRASKVSADDPAEAGPPSWAEFHSIIAWD
jgi:hypothetical protein